MQFTGQSNLDQTDQTQNGQTRVVMDKIKNACPEIANPGQLEMPIPLHRNIWNWSNLASSGLYEKAISSAKPVDSFY